MKILSRALIIIGLIILAIAAFSPRLFADITIVRNLKLKTADKSGSIQARTATQVHGHMARRETEVLTSGPLADEFHYPVRSINWVSLDKGTVHIFDHAKADFEKVSLSRWSSYLSRVGGPAEPTGFHISQTWSRIIPEDETKKVRGQECRKFTYEWRFEIENPETYAKKQYGVRTTLWLADLPPALLNRLGEERGFQADYRKRLGGPALEDLNAVTMQYAAQHVGLDKETLFEAVSQGTARLQKIHGYPMATQSEWFVVGFKSNKTLFTVTSSLETLSLKPLAETVFIPSKKYISSYDEMDINAQLIAKGE